MIQIRRLKHILLAVALVGSFSYSVALFQAPKVLAASCIEEPTGDAQATGQMECVDKFQKDCKKQGFPDAFCNDLSAKDVNKCATSGSEYTLKKGCVQDLKKKWDKNKDNSDPADNGDASGVTHNKDDCSADSTADLDSSNCGIIDWIVKITNALAALAGTIIVAMIIWGGIQYSMAGADPSKVQAAKKKIVSALTALLLLVFGFSIVQWLVPGGLF